MIRGALGHHRTFVTERHYLRNRAHPDIVSLAAALDRTLEDPKGEGDDAPGTTVVALFVVRDPSAPSGVIISVPNRPASEVAGKLNSGTWNYVMGQ